LAALLHFCPDSKKNLFAANLREWARILWKGAETCIPLLKAENV
jgi:hypothetical protein